MGNLKHPKNEPFKYKQKIGGRSQSTKFIFDYRSNLVIIDNLTMKIHVHIKKLNNVPKTTLK